MTRRTADLWTCDYGSGANLRINRNAAHCVLSVTEGADILSSTIALTPRSMREVGRRLQEIADALTMEAENGEAR